MSLPTEMTPREREIIYGTLMGDAYIHVKWPEFNNISLMMTRQCAHREYMDWFMIELQRFDPTLRPQQYNRTTTTKYMGNHVRVQIPCDNKTESSLVLRTSTRTPIWKQLYDQFYSGERKKCHIPVEELTPLALAVLWQDDGTTNGSWYTYGRLNVQGFPLSERQILQQYLDEIS